MPENTKIDWINDNFVNDIQAEIQRLKEEKDVDLIDIDITDSLKTSIMQIVEHIKKTKNIDVDLETVLSALACLAFNKGKVDIKAKKITLKLPQK